MVNVQQPRGRQGRRCPQYTAIQTTFLDAQTTVLDLNLLVLDRACLNWLEPACIVGRIVGAYISGDVGGQRRAYMHPDGARPIYISRICRKQGCLNLLVLWGVLRVPTCPEL